MAESSLAADLLADFNDSDEEELEENGTSISNDLLSDQPNSRQSRSRDLMMDLDGDEEGDDDDEDEEMTGTVLPQDKDDLSIDDDEETRKLKVESMNFGAMNDVRSVAKLMKVLEPVLEVSNKIIARMTRRVLTLTITRKSPTTNPSPPPPPKET